MEDTTLATQVDQSFENPEKSMEDTIRETYKSIESRGESEITKPPVENTAAKPAPTRDEAGKFTKLPQAEVKTEGKPATPVTRKAPASWKKEAAEKYPALDPLLQEEIDRREGDFHKFYAAVKPFIPAGAQGEFKDQIEAVGREMGTLKHRAQVAEEFERSVAPYMATINSFGVSPVVAAAELFKADHQLRYGTPIQKLQMFQKIANDYGIDLRPLMQASQEGQPLQVDPNIEYLQQQVQGLHATLQAQQRERQQQEQNSVTTEIQQFAADPKYEHFETVRHDMAALLQAGRAKNMVEAYETAVWANPTTRQIMIAKQQEEINAENQRKADEAKRAAQVNIPKRGNVTPAAPVGSMEDTIRATAKRLNLIS